MQVCQNLDLSFAGETSGSFSVTSLLPTAEHSCERLGIPSTSGTSAGPPRTPTDAYQTYFYRSNVIFFLPLINDFPLSRALTLCVFWQTNLGANQFCTVKIEIMTFCGFSLQRGNRIYSLVRGDACRYSPSTICKCQNFSLSHSSVLVSCEPPLSIASISQKKKKTCAKTHRQLAVCDVTGGTVTSPRLAPRSSAAALQTHEGSGKAYLSAGSRCMSNMSLFPGYQSYCSLKYSISEAAPLAIHPGSPIRFESR